ncbi:MAG: zinc-dependent alcohol dehydrogenase family protein [Spirochaetaceae bacterium]|nr:MAG: zinc-dependent alcohol dehydrogenase family protein [Spirochaetaceae bacterium]
MNYRAAVFHDTEHITIQTKEVRKPGPKEVLIRVRACGVCGTDLHLYHGAPGSASATPPVVLGHEFAGEVTETGSDVTDLRSGDQVTVDPNLACGDCWYCRNGERNLCSNLTAIGVNFDGGFAEYCLVPFSQVYRFDRPVSHHHAAMAEPLACCLHGIDRVALKQGQTVAVVGCGAIGLIMVQLAFLGGASRVYASDPVAKRRDLAEQLGAVPVDPGRQELPTVIRRDIPEGVDSAVECAGNPAAMLQAFQSVRRGGTVLLFSVPEADAVLNVPVYDIYFRELRILGSFTNPATQGRAVDLVSSGRIQLEQLISHQLPLESIKDAFRLFGKPDAIKIVVAL